MLRLKPVRVFSVLLLFCFLVSFTGERERWLRLFTVKTAADFFTTDNLGNLYVIKGDELFKYNSNGELLKKYSNKNLGKIFSVDASNALRLLIHYKDFSVITLLDSQLSQNGENISLEDKGLEQCDVACSSFQNGIWLYNRQNAELVRLDESLNKVVSTGNLNRLLSTELHPDFMVENNGFLYLNNGGKGILVFDIYGTYSKTIPIKSAGAFQVRDAELYYYTNKKLKDYHSKELWQIEMELPDTNAAALRIETGKYFLQYKDSLCAYNLSTY